MNMVRNDNPTSIEFNNPNALKAIRRIEFETTFEIKKNVTLPPVRCYMLWYLVKKYEEFKDSEDDDCNYCN